MLSLCSRRDLVKSGWRWLRWLLVSFSDWCSVLYLHQLLVFVVCSVLMPWKQVSWVASLLHLRAVTLTPPVIQQFCSDGC
jgi:hypothetical protein